MEALQSHPFYGLEAGVAHQLQQFVVIDKVEPAEAAPLVIQVLVDEVVHLLQTVIDLSDLVDWNGIELHEFVHESYLALGEGLRH